MRVTIRVARGVTRVALLIGPWAVKMPRLYSSSRGALWSIAHGVLANLSEREWSAWPGVCPVRWSLLGGLVNIYPRAEPAPDGAIDYVSISPPQLSCDPKPGNVGVLHGRTVWVDYDQSGGECVACLRFRHEQSTP